MLVVLVGFAFGQLFGYKGGVITIVGQGFSNTLSQYDDFAPGSLFKPSDLSPLSFTVDDFHVKWLTSGPEMGQPESFDANVTYRTSPDAAPQKHDLAVNHPLSIAGTDVFLVGHGYAPVVTVRDGKGKVAYKGPVVFLPQDSSSASFGVVKVPDAAAAAARLRGAVPADVRLHPRRGPVLAVPRRPRTRCCPWCRTTATSASTAASRSRSTPWQVLPAQDLPQLRPDGSARSSGSSSRWGRP